MKKEMPVEFPKEGLHGCRVLIVEDRYLVADDLRRLLTRNGGEVVAVVADVEEAKKLAASGDLDLGVLDVDLRGQDVFDAAAILETRGVPFLFVTGFPRAYLPERYRAFPIVAKPYSEAELIARIGELLHGKDQPGSGGR